MEWVLKMLGYKEKSGDAYAIMQHACMLNVETKERLEKLKATLNGEDHWFKEKTDDVE